MLRPILVGLACALVTACIVWVIMSLLLGLPIL